MKTVIGRLGVFGLGFVVGGLVGLIAGLVLGISGGSINTRIDFCADDGSQYYIHDMTARHAACDPDR